MSDKKGSDTYKLIKWIIKLCYPKTTVEGIENLPSESSIIVGNHTHMNGPIACELYFPGNHCTWCTWQMMHLKEVPDYAYKDFWSYKPKYIQWFYKLLSYIIAPLSVCIFNNASTVAVYRDARLLYTFRDTVKKLQDGVNVIIFPEHDADHNHIICEFQDKFIDIAKLYYKRTGIELNFVPMYIAPALKKMYIGKPIHFCHKNDINEERKRICSYLMDEISNIACSLPRHKVVPYRNVSKKLYNYNIPNEVISNEKNSC